MKKSRRRKKNKTKVKLTKKKSPVKKITKKSVALKKVSPKTQKTQSTRAIFDLNKLPESQAFTPAATNDNVENLMAIAQSLEASTPEKSLVIGLSDQEIENLLTKKDIQTDEDKENYAKIFEELARHLPDREAVVTTQPAKTRNIVIQHIESRHEHSPFVLNLHRALEEKQAIEKRKSFVQQKFSKLKNPLQLNQSKAKDLVNILRKEPKAITPEEKDFLATTLNENSLQIKKTLAEAEIQEQFTGAPLFRLPALWYKPVIIFAALCLLAILPIKGFTFYQELSENKNSIIAASQSGLADLQLAGAALVSQDATTANEKFSAARFDFEQAQTNLNSINGVLSDLIKIIPGTGKYLTSAERLTAAGKTSTEIGIEITALFDKFYAKDSTLSLTEKLTELKNQTAATILPKLKILNTDLALVDASVLPTDKQPIFKTVRENLQQLTRALEELSSFATSLNDILGATGKKRYLIIFQNNNELRPTGGFMGSLAIVDIHHGAVSALNIPGGGPYDFKGSLTKQLLSPAPLQLINPKWELQDANWFFDFPTSAKKIQWFLENSGGSSVDGIIAINSSLIEKILSATAPIDMPDYGKTITAANFLSETQKSVELEYDKATNKPKQFIADLTPKLLNQLFDTTKTDWLKIAEILRTGLTEKDILLYFNDPDIENKFMTYNWTGEIKNTSKDYLAVVNTNIGGGKTDSSIIQNIQHEATIGRDGYVIDTLTITRKHNGGTNLLYSDIRNVNYLRVYVPAGSKLLSASGFSIPEDKLFKLPAKNLMTDELLTQTETDKQIDPTTQTLIYNEHGKTVFANWTMTDPGEQSIIKLTYQLPYKLEINQPNLLQSLLGETQEKKFYSLFYQKEPGSQKTTLTSTLNIPNTLNISWDVAGEHGATTHTDAFTHDLVFGYILENK